MDEITIKRVSDTSWAVVFPDGHIAIEFAGHAGQAAADAWVRGYKAGWIDKTNETVTKMTKALENVRKQ